MQYTERITALEEALTVQKKKKNIVAAARLLSLAAAFLLAWKLYPYGLIASFTAFVVFLASFLYLVALSTDLNRRLKILEHLLSINREELETAAHRFHHRADGSQYLPARHEYAHDLDLFGRASLFQYLHRTTSEQGSALLADWLLHPATPGTILQRQEAARELAGKQAFRQELQALGMLTPVSLATENKISSFLTMPPSLFTRGAWRYIRIAGPVTICLLLGAYMADLIGNAVFYSAVFASFLFTGWISKKVMPLYLGLSRISAEMDTLKEVLEHIEKGSFASEPLQRIQNALRDGHVPASIAIRRFRGILDRMDLRLNPLVFIPLNIFLFWDLQQLFALEKWREQHPHGASPWIRAIAEMEALQSLGTLHANHPGWAFPLLAAEHGSFTGTGIGHPLISEEKRVSSSFSTTGTPQISLVTGSNMAGKSTFLRSLGINTVLAMAGAPVCAETLTLSPMRVMSSMRIADNLEESTSTFYAELKKLKEIIEAVKRKEHVFLLLDEILRGTNSLDRHTGSAALIRQLIREKAVAVIATHDLELTALKDIGAGELKNYHFDVQVRGEELYFDYALKDGICSSMNASLLMKKIGIEM